MVPEGRKKVFGIFIIVVILLLCLTFSVLYFGNVFKGSDSKKANSQTDGLKRKSHSNVTSPARKFTKDEADDAAKTTTTTQMSTTTETESEGPEYRVYLNGSTSSGKVFITAGDQVGFVCSDGYDNNAALVTCRELGYKQGFAYNLMTKGNYIYYTTFEPILSGINCTGSEMKLSDCDGFELTNETFCSWFAAAFCYNDEPYELRLFNGTYPHSGLVEMKIAGEWRLFCGIRMFDDDLADILCRMMNYTGGLTLEQGTLGPTNYTKVWAPYIYCGTEAEIKRSIFECELILHTENILVDYTDFRSNRYNHEYMSCLGEQDSFAAAVHCLGENT